MYNKSMTYEWDSSKERANWEIHQVGFAAIESFDWATAVIRRQERPGEVRYRAIGYIGNQLHVVIYTVRGEAIRVISIWRAGSRARRRYAES